MKLDTLQIVGGSLGLNSQWLCLLHAFHFGTLLQRALWSKLSERQHGEEGEREGERGGRKNPSSLKYRHSAAFTRLSPLSPPSSCWKKGFTFQTRLYSLPAAFFFARLCWHLNPMFFSWYSFFNIFLLSVDHEKNAPRCAADVPWPRSRTNTRWGFWSVVFSSQSNSTDDWGKMYRFFFCLTQLKQQQMNSRVIHVFNILIYLVWHSVLCSINYRNEEWETIRKMCCITLTKSHITVVLSKKKLVSVERVTEPLNLVSCSLWIIHAELTVVRCKCECEWWFVPICQRIGWKFCRLSGDVTSWCHTDLMLLILIQYKIWRYLVLVNWIWNVQILFGMNLKKKYIFLTAAGFILTTRRFVLEGTSGLSLDDRQRNAFISLTWFSPLLAICPHWSESVREQNHRKWDLSSIYSHFEMWH